MDRRAWDYGGDLNLITRAPYRQGRCMARGRGAALNPVWRKIGQHAKWGGGCVLVVTAVVDVYEITTSDDPGRSTAGAVGRWAGAYAGGVAGAELGALVGSFFPGPGTVIGAVIGGFIGAAFGGWAGGKAAEDVYDYAAGEPARVPGGPTSTGISGWH